MEEGAQSAEVIPVVLPVSLLRYAPPLLRVWLVTPRLILLEFRVRK